MSDRFPWIGMISSGDVDDLRVDILADAIEAAYRAGRSGSDEERSARDLLARLDAAAPVAREDTASSDEDVADPCIEDALGTCHAPGHWHEGQRRRSASPTVAPDAQRAATEPNSSAPGEGSGVDSTSRVNVPDQRAAPTRDALDARVRVALLLSASEVSDGYPLPRGRFVSKATPRIVALIDELLRGGGADGGGKEGPSQDEVEDLRWESMIDAKIGELAAAAGISRAHLRWEDILGSVRVILDALRDKVGATANDLVSPGVSLRVGVAGTPPADIARLARAAGVSPDSEDVVGAIEAAIRAGREPEVVTGTEANALPPGSIVSQWVDERPVDALTHYFSGWARSGATRWGFHENLDSGSGAEWVVWYRAPEQEPEPPAPLQIGDVVTGDRAVSAPVGTTLGAKSATVAAVHTVNGWVVTGMGREQDHEGHVRANEWVVLALGDGSET